VTAIWEVRRVRNQERSKVASVAEWAFRLGTTTLAVLGGFVTLGSPAWAADMAAPANFGILGPVGLIAVGVGVLGMIAGLARRRRQALGRSVAARSAAAEQAAADRAARVAASQPIGEQHVPGPSQPAAIERTGQQTAIREPA
jgi:hypothetical protein